MRTLLSDESLIMLHAKNVETCKFNISLKNGVLDFVVDVVVVGGSVRPFIVRKLRLSHARQRIQTEQHVVIKSAEELFDWIAKDEFYSEHPDIFNKLRDACLKVLL